MSEIADAVQGTIGDLFGEQTEDAPAEAPEAAVQETEVEAAVELPDWEAASRDLFTEDEEDEPDFTALADEELSEVEDTNLVPTEYDDEDTARLKREALAAKKKAEHFERLHLKNSRKAWEADVRSQPWAEFLPKDLSNMKATSHRDFIKQARVIARANAEVLKPHFEKLQAERDRLAELARAEARQEVQTAWGKPTVGSGRVPPTAAQQQSDVDQAVEDRLIAARKNRSLVDSVKAMIDGGLV